MSGKEHRLVADYSFSSPRGNERKKSETVKYVIMPNGQRKKIWSYERSLIEVCEAYYLPVKEVVEERTEEPIREEWSIRRAQINQNWAEVEEGKVYVDNGSATVETPSSLGASEHLRRRKIVEDLLKEFGVEFTLDCAAKFSEAVCKPLNLPQPSKDEEEEAAGLGVLFG